jgi:hypothetical protein
VLVATKKEKTADLETAVIRICPACGVVNPSGPSEDCPHLQIVRFDGIDRELEDLLAQVAGARRSYSDLAALLKKTVIDAAKEGAAKVETPRKIQPGEVDELYPKTVKAERLSLKAVKSKAKKAKPRRTRRTGPAPVDPRQLDLLALSPPKGDA